MAHLPMQLVQKIKEEPSLWAMAGAKQVSKLLLRA
jgi:hypothetical protein